jgi:RimJ/RimL family protein N-acetyltransferase
MARLIGVDERFNGEQVSLRLVTVDDCTARYVGWLEDPAINRFLETRWAPQTLASVRQFVEQQLQSADSYLFAIVANRGAAHIGNIKVGPIHARHLYADVSYFIGDREFWGKGFATDAIRLATRIGFERLGVNRLQAGLYATNVGSGRALEKAGYTLEGRFKAQLRLADAWDDHVWYGLTKEDWSRGARP